MSVLFNEEVKKQIIKQSERVIKIEQQAITDFLNQIHGNETTRESLQRAVEVLYKTDGKIIVTGVGKSGHIARKMASTLSSTGTPAFFVHAAESSHGDLGMISDADTVLAISYGGESAELGSLLQFVARRNIPLVAMTGKVQSTLARSAQVVVDVSVREEACPLGLAPTASSTLTLVLCDVLAMALMELRGFSPEGFSEFHPGGSLGLKLQKVKDVMQTGEALPFIRPEASIREILTAMTHRSVRGAAGVTDASGNLVGIITDGDIRRLLESKEKEKGEVIFAMKAKDFMGKNPRTIDCHELVEKALFLMEQFRIQMLIVLDSQSENPKKPVGMIHFQDLIPKLKK